MKGNLPMSEPPEGVVSGESVPIGSEPDNYHESEIQEIMAVLKSKGRPFTEMSETELRERALNFKHKYMD